MGNNINIKCIFFDFDGVLAESVNIKTEAFREMYLSYGEVFAERVVKFHLQNGGISRYEKVKVFNGEWLGENVTEEKVHELAAEFSSLVVDGVVNAPEVKGAKDFLDTSKKYKKFIITGTPTVEIKQILKRRNMDSYFIESYGSPEKKGHWVKHILKEQNLAANECVFIGDALADYEAAKENKVTFILRETLIAEELFKDYTGFRIKDMSSLHNILKTIKK